jgi:hypothetical protein
MPIDAVHGDTGTGKSLMLERLAGHLWEHGGMKSRVLIGDGGADTYNDRGLVDDGVIEVVDYSSWDYPMEALKLISNLWFPRDWRDPHSKLVAPKPDVHEKYGLWIFEGGSVMGNWLLSDVPGGFGWHAATETGFGGIKDEDGLLSITDDFKGAEAADSFKQSGAVTGKHFGLAQRKIVNAIRTSKKFPKMVFWTFHSTEGPDKGAGGTTKQFGEITGKKIIGPDLGGKALASTIGREFGNLFHADQAVTRKTELDKVTNQQITHVKTEFRLYTRRHFDPNKDVMVEYVAGTRFSKAKDFYTSKDPGDTLLQFYQDVKNHLNDERAKRQAKEEQKNGI